MCYPPTLEGRKEKRTEEKREGGGEEFENSSTL
jgi:hypothetical protein